MCSGIVQKTAIDGSPPYRKPPAAGQPQGTGDGAAGAHAGPPPVQLQRAEGAAMALLHRQGEGTRLRRLRQSGCLKLRFPRLPGPLAEAVLINTSGGLTGGDRLDCALSVEEGGELSATTQACERIYRSAGGVAEMDLRLSVAKGAWLAWVPQETILFEGGALKRRLTLDAERGSSFMMCESVILGRQMMGEDVALGSLRDSWRVRLDGRLVFADELRLEGAIGDIGASAASLAGQRAFATLVFHGPDLLRRLDAARTIIGEAGGASIADDILVCRLRASSGLALRKTLVPLLTALAERPLSRLWAL